MIIEIFKAGTWTDSSGNTRTWTEQDLDSIVQKYNEQKDHEAPVVIGHPKDNAPAYGWVEKLEKRGSSLWAKIKPTVQEFVDWVRQGLYKKVSISLYPDMLLRHVGFLGAVPPAVKGLKLPQFAEGQYTEYEIDFRDWTAEERERLAKGETTKKLKEVNMEEKLKELEEKLKEKERALAEFAEKEKTKDEELARLKAEVGAVRAEKRKAEFNAFCEDLIKEGKLTPAMKPFVLDFMEILHGIGEYEFSEGDSKVKAQPIEKFKAFLIGLPKQVEFSEIATKDKTVEGKTEIKNIKNMSGWELIEMYKNNPQNFAELVEKNINRRN